MIIKTVSQLRLGLRSPKRSEKVTPAIYLISMQLGRRYHYLNGTDYALFNGYFFAFFF